MGKKEINSTPKGNHALPHAGPVCGRCGNILRYSSPDGAKDTAAIKHDQRAEGEIAEIVRQYGWYAANIHNANPPFLYSIGLMQTWDHPELIVFGLQSEKALGILSNMVDLIRAGGSYRQPGTFSGILQNDFPISTRLVDPTQHPVYLRYAGLLHASRTRRRLAGGASILAR